MCRCVSCLLIPLLVATYACAPSSDPDATDVANEVAGQPSDWFIDGARASGLEFLHINGASGNYYYPEILPPGAGFLDYDNDGDLDACLAQGYPLDTENTRGPLTCFRNDLDRDSNDAQTLRFTDVTVAAGFVTPGFGLGMATGDVDNDGWIDLLVTTYGPVQLYRNNGDGTFSDISSSSGLTATVGFGVSAAFVDYDRDGWLDLYVGHNVDYQLDNPITCDNRAGARDYCPPETYGGTPDHLYRNNGNGQFVDVSDTALIGGTFGPALGVVTADYDGDGWTDIYVANDATENILWINQHDGTFRDNALLSGAAVSATGVAEASMGVDAGDFDNDGDEDLFMTHITAEGNNLYVNDGQGQFVDRSTPSGLGPGSFPYTGWGTTWFDFDNDGWLDLLALNGTVIANQERLDAPFPYDQRNSLFRNQQTGRFEDVTDQAGTVFEHSHVGRGAAFGDVDNDGDLDVLIGNDAGMAQLLLNNIGNRHHWLGLRLTGGGGRDMLGARIVIRREGAPTLSRRARTDGSYASANDPRVLVGLGDFTTKPSVTVFWPTGEVENWADVNIDHWISLEQGTGQTQTP